MSDIIKARTVEADDLSGYEFEYYENGGELVGRYKYLSSDEALIPPSLFGQNCSIEKYSSLTNPSINMGSDDRVLAIYFNYTPDDGLDMSLERPKVTEEYVTSFFAGEFHLITNSVKAVKRINLPYDIFIGGQRVVSPRLKEGSANLPIQWILGYSKVPESDRPENMSETPLTPILGNRVEATLNLKWKSLRVSCFSWIKIYDGEDLSDLLRSRAMDNGQYVIQLRCVIDKEALSYWLGSDSGSGKIVVYPPSFYIYPVDSVTRFVSPKINAINNDLTEIVFETPQNFKVDGNIHFSLRFLTAHNSSDILFETSSFWDIESYEESSWFYSMNGKDWIDIPPGRPTFDNSYEIENGLDAENAILVKYVLSEGIKETIRSKPDLYFKLIQHDGTLRKE